MKQLPVGRNLVEGQVINNLINQVFGASGDVTATAGGGQANAAQLSVGLNYLSVVATGGDSVKLPTAVANPDYGISLVLIYNAGNETADVYPANASDKIAAGGAGVADTLAAGKGVVYFCAVTGVWGKVLSA